MSIIERTLNDALNFIRAYLRTFFRLILQPNRVLNNLADGFNGSVKYVSPTLFFVFATFVSFTLRVESHSDFFSIKNLSEYPSFIHNMTILDVILYSSPMLLIAYLMLQVSTRIFSINAQVRPIYRGYLLYSFGLAQLMVFLAMALSLFIKGAPAFASHDLVNSILQTLHIVILLSAYFFAMVIPIRTVYVRFFRAAKQNFTSFLTVPGMILLFFYCTDTVGALIEAYRPTPPEKEKLQLITSPDTPNVIAIQYNTSADSTFSRTSIQLYNPTNEIIIVPRELMITLAPRFVPNKPSLVHFINLHLTRQNDDFLRPGELRRATYYVATPNSDTLVLCRRRSDTLKGELRIILSYSNFDRKWNTAYLNYYAVHFKRMPMDSLKRY
ncbi:MAG TPA: hypothetical protein VK890_01880 [Bacteroidia bacterium]|jgi:hypothetical protein|nr:hypothetical protein [Bacteroidia bacterium]